MSEVVTFQNVRPSPRYDLLPWTEVRIEEAPAFEGPWAEIDVIVLDPVDADPSKPATRQITTELGTAPDLWYRLIFADASGDTLQPTFPVQNTAARPIYATATELAGILRVNEQQHCDALQRVLEAAALEIDKELGREDPFTQPPALVVEVNLERAVEHWRQMQSPFGIVGLGGEVGLSVFTARDSWERHANKLAALKESWGLA